MKDLRGQEIKLGDKVVTTAYGGYAELNISEIIGFTPKKVRIKEVAGAGLRTPNQIVVLERNPVREEELKAEQKPEKDKDLKL